MLVKHWLRLRHRLGLDIRCTEATCANSILGLFTRVFTHWLVSGAIDKVWRETNVNNKTNKKTVELGVCVQEYINIIPFIRVSASVFDI